MKDLTLKFCFKGSRDYVHGTDIYNSLIEELDLKSSTGEFDLSFHGIARTNLQLTEERPDE